MLISAPTASTTPAGRTAAAPLPPESEINAMPAADTASAAIETGGTRSPINSGASIAMTIGPAYVISTALATDVCLIAAKYRPQCTASRPPRANTGQGGGRRRSQRRSATRMIAAETADSSTRKPTMVSAGIGSFRTITPITPQDSALPATISDPAVWRGTRSTLESGVRGPTRSSVADRRRAGDPGRGTRRTGPDDASRRRGRGHVPGVRDAAEPGAGAPG